MKVLHTKEYKALVIDFFGKLPSCDSFSMYSECFLKLSEVPIPQLRRAFLDCLISRFRSQQNYSKLEFTPRILRQLVLSMRLSDLEIAKIKQYLTLPL